MSANLTLAPSDANTGTRSSPRIRWQDGSRDPLALGLMKPLGMQRASTVELLIRKLPQQAATIIRAFRAAGAEKRLASWLEPITRAAEGREPPPDCPATWDLAQVADMREDTDESRYLREPSVPNRARLIASSREEIRRQVARLDMLIDEQWRAERDAERHS